MTDLLIEVWQGEEDSQTMGPVIEFNDIRHPPAAVLVHSFRARSWAEAQYIYDMWCGIDAILPEDAFEEPFTTEERAVQDEYLRRRVKRI